MAEKQLDRVSYTFGVKVNIGNYESVSMSASFSSDVGGRESVEDSMNRVSDFVEKFIKEKEQLLKSGNEPNCEFEKE